MKLLSHICHDSDVSKKIDWITNELGFHVFKIQRIYDKNFDSEYSAIIFIVNNDEEESYLKLKYPVGIFTDL
jgi:hypothetical protein